MMIRIVVFFLLSNYSFSQVNFFVEKSKEVKLSIKKILQEKNNLNIDSLYVGNLISDKRFDYKKDSGVYIVYTDVLHFGRSLLFKNQNNYTFYNSVSELEPLLKEVLEIKDIDDKQKRKYLKKVYSYFIDFLDRKTQNEILIIPKNNIDSYKDK